MSARATVITALTAVALIAAPTVPNWGPRFIWNASASVPIGLYRLEPVSRVAVSDLAVVVPPPPLAAFLSRRGYLARGVPLIKRVLAVFGTSVCRRGATIIAYDHAYGQARLTDRRGRPLPSWQGCQELARGEVFLMNWNASDSFDGRYFGPLPTSAIVARALPVWTDADGDGRFTWQVGDPADAP